MAVALVGVVVAAPLTGSGRHIDEPSSGVQVTALWYGRAPDGTVQAGVTPVGISASFHDPITPLLIDTGGLTASGAGPMWTAATAVAEVQAVLASGVDPRSVQLTYSLDEAIDGPSAGGVLSAGSLAAIQGLPLSPDTTMTGTILPDGSIGPVAGISDKLRAAKAAGFRRVLVPAGSSTDLTTGAAVDPVSFGEAMGVEVVPVASMSQAVALLTNTPEKSSPGEPPALPDGLLQMLDRRSRSLVTTTTTELLGLAGSSDSTTVSTLPEIQAWLTAAQRATEDGDPVLAFASAAEAAQATRILIAVERLHQDATLTSLDDLVARTGRDLAGFRAVISQQVQLTAERPVSSIAQLTALPDAVAWGVFAVTSMDVAEQQLATVGSQADLDRVVRFVETARFEADVYMSATAESLSYIGRTPITDRQDAVGLLDAYATLVADGAQANRAYADRLRPADDRNTYLRQLIESSDPLTAESSNATTPPATSTARPVLRMAAALLEYVETTQLVNDLTAQPVTGLSVPPNLLPVRDPATLATQASNATNIASQQAQLIADAGLDPTYLQWNSRWGAILSSKSLPRITDEQALHGLVYQWFAVLQSRLLLAMSR